MIAARRALVAVTAFSVASAAVAQDVVQPAAAATNAPLLVVQKPPAPDGKLLLERDTLIRLMVTREVNSRTAKIGDRFNLRVDEDVLVDGKIVIPVGSKALGEVTAAEEMAPSASQEF